MSLMRLVRDYVGLGDSDVCTRLVYTSCLMKKNSRHSEGNPLVPLDNSLVVS